MELYLTRRAEYDRLYNCTIYNVDSVPVESRQRVVIGSVMLVLVSIYVIIYVPCLWIIGGNLSKPAYKIMLAIGLLDVFMLTCVTGVYGVFAIRGDVFCSHPTLTYIIGCFDLGIWVSSTELTVLLALYRCIQMWRPDLASFLVTGRRTLAWIFLSLGHMMFVICFTTPIFWNSIYVKMPFNPHAGYVDDADQKYHNLHHNIHNLCILFDLIGLYILFAIIVVSKKRQMRSTSTSMSKAQRESFFQAVLISACAASRTPYGR